MGGPPLSVGTGSKRKKGNEDYLHFCSKYLSKYSSILPDKAQSNSHIRKGKDLILSFYVPRRERRIALFPPFPHSWGEG